ncbi:SDR family oxidoreductase [Mycobacterium sp. URHB0044]|jgi:NAD(P)-dependent dehydrogenase (short-subunit alcohol dehydrogenase family)|uniref:SDR family oxidoreductase n=1 Tax=Mycobacterium sp. URHB0044 TaxID=1380386 RepID=UPI00056994A5|nr:SDR family oxidoreductase [Mycobacterium sp. URHB0044]
MTRVAVITGGAGGMGLATAKIVGRDHTVVLCDVRQDRLDAAAATLKDLGMTATAVNCDVTDRQAVVALFETAAGLGTVAAVVHAAGVSPSMGDADYVMRTNALGTLNVNEVFYETAAEGAAIVNVASMAAHMLPEEMTPTARFPRALQDEQAFMTDMLASCNVVPDEMRSGIAYSVSKSFVKWYSSSQAERFNGRGLRIVSVSPGSIDTEMGRLEEQAGAGAMVVDAAVPRWGKPEELAELFAFCVSDKAGYLTGTDILNDGGVIASIKERARVTEAAKTGQP